MTHRGEPVHQRVLGHQGRAGADLLPGRVLEGDEARRRHRHVRVHVRQSRHQGATGAVDDGRPGCVDGARRDRLDQIALDEHVHPHLQAVAGAVEDVDVREERPSRGVLLSAREWGGEQRREENEQRCPSITHVVCSFPSKPDQADRWPQRQDEGQLAYPSMRFLLVGKGEREEARGQRTGVPGVVSTGLRSYVQTWRGCSGWRTLPPERSTRWKGGRGPGRGYSTTVASGDVSRVRIDSSVRSIDSRAAELMSRPTKIRRTTGMDRLSVSDSHSMTTPPSTAA